MTSKIAKKIACIICTGIIVMECCAQFFYKIFEFVKVGKSAEKIACICSSVHVSPLMNVGCNHKGPKCIVHH